MSQFGTGDEIISGCALDAIGPSLLGFIDVGGVEISSCSLLQKVRVNKLRQNTAIVSARLYHY